MGLIAWLSVWCLWPQNPLEQALYDKQHDFLLLWEGDPRPPTELVMAAIDRQAFELGLRRSDLPEVVQALEGQVVNVDTRALSPFLEPDSDGHLRSVQLFRTDGDKQILSPPLLDYLKFRGVPPENVEVTDNGIWVGKEFIPTDSEGRFYPYFPVVDQYTLVTKQLGLSFLGRTDFEHMATRPSFEPVSIPVLFENEVSLNGRLTLCGVFLPEAESVQYDTPGGDMVKLQLYTTVLSNLFRGDFFRPLSTVSSVLLALAVLAALSLLLPGRTTVGSVGCWGLWLGGWLGLNLLFFSERVFVNQGAPIIAGVVMLIFHLLRRSWRVNNLLRGLGGRAPLAATGEEVEATILFTNLPDQLKELEESSAEDAQAARASYSSCLGHIVNQHGGRLVDTQGDAQMLAFGLEGGPHETQAVSCALDIVEKVNLLLGLEPGASPQVFCGAVTGKVATGQVGGGDYRSVAAIGDTTNSAARLMGQAKNRKLPVLVSKDTTLALGARAVTERVGELAVKGKTEPLQVFEVQSFEAPAITPQEVKPTRSLARYTLVVAVILVVLLAQLLSSQAFFRLPLLDSVSTGGQVAPIIFAGINEESLAAHEWPWPRSLHAQAIENCLAAGASCVFLDLLFEDKSEMTEDKRLVETVLDSERVFVAAASQAGFGALPGPPVLLPELQGSKSWGLINHSPGNQGDLLRYGLWELQLNNGELAPGIAKQIVSLTAPQETSALQGQTEFLITWGPLPRQVAYHRLLDPSDPIFEMMTGKMVIVGDNLQGRSDLFETPVGPLKGGLIHAQSIQTILGGELLVDKSSHVAVLVISLCLAGVMIFFCWQTAGVYEQLCLLLGGVSAGLLCLSLASAGGYFIGPLPVLSGGLAVLAGWLLTVVDTNRSLTNYIPRRLQQQLERDGTVADITTEGTILLTDIRGYTSLSEGRSPAEILALLNRYHEQTAAVYERYGGHLLTYQGDAQIIVFGPLEPLANPALSALQAAREISPVVEEVAAEAGLDEGALRVGSGITTGNITLSLLGVSGQLQYSVFGAPVRKAHHLQSYSDELNAPVILDERSAVKVRDVERLEERVGDDGDTIYILARTLQSQGQ